MRFHVVTLFPELLDSPFEYSILGKARQQGKIAVELWPLRDYGCGRHQVTDDTPYGGGGGMIMKPEPVATALDDVCHQDKHTHRILLSPQGQRLDQGKVEDLAAKPSLTFVCGRYEGFDERIRSYVDEELSIGDYVLTGGELAALVVIDAVARYCPGVLGNKTGASNDSFAQQLLEYPQYTRPESYRGQQVPQVLLSGDHAAIAQWRRRQQLLRTCRRRPDLLARQELSAQERQWLLATVGADPQSQDITSNSNGDNPVQETS